MLRGKNGEIALGLRGHGRWLRTPLLAASLALLLLPGGLVRSEPAGAAAVYVPSFGGGTILRVFPTNPPTLPVETPEVNNQTISLAGNVYTVTDSTAPLIAGSGCSQVNANEVSCPQASITQLQVDTGQLNDEVTMLAPTPATLIGGTGNDTLNAGPAATRFAASAGDGDDTLSGGPSIDTASYSERSTTAPIVASLAIGSGGEAGETDTYTGIENLVGSLGDDTLTGNDGDNRLEGGAGDDTLSGGLGNDKLMGDADNDLLNTDPGADELIGGAGSDSADYSSRAANQSISQNGLADDGDSSDGPAGTRDNIAADVEVLRGGSGTDFITGGNANNQIDGGPGLDVLSGGGGSDTIHGGVSAGAGDVLHGDNGNDTLVGDVPGTLMYGDAGDDTLANSQDPPGDVLSGGTGTDTADYSGRFSSVVLDTATVYGNGVAGENDTIAADVENLIGGPADDVLAGPASVDNDFNGGPGMDTIKYVDRVNPVVASLATGSGGEAGENDTYHSIEALEGGAADDSLTGNDKDNRLDGRGGDDTLAGGLGMDTVSYADRVNPVVASLAAGSGGEAGENDTLAGIEGLEGGAAGDSLTGDDGDNRLEGRAGNDTLGGGLGADVLDGGDDTDTVSYAGRGENLEVTLNDVADDGAGGEGDNVTGGVEHVIGGSGDDRLVGANGKTEILDGGPGDDLLDGRTGADTLVGGSDFDTVDYSKRTDNVTADLAGSAGDGVAGENDTIAGDVEGIEGGLGDDVLLGNDAANTLSGGPGNDLLDGSGGGDTMSGGSGSDTVSYATRSAPVAVDITTPGGDGQAGEGDDVTADVEQLIGGGAGDLLIGGPGGNTLIGNGGGDLLFGHDGFDVLIGGAGNDGLAGEGGRDILDGSDGNDSLSGAAGNDSLDGGLGDDALDGGTGDDDLSGGPGSDVASYAQRTAPLTLSTDGNQNDGQQGESDNLRNDVEGIVAGAGNDTIDARNDRATSVVCGAGRDLVTTDFGGIDQTAADCESVVRSQRFGAVAIRTRSTRASRKGRVTVVVSCSSFGECAGRVRLRARKRTVKRHGKRIRIPSSLASGSYKLRGGQRKRLRLRLSKKARRALTRAGKISARVTATPERESIRSPVSKNISVKAPKTKKRKRRR